MSNPIPALRMADELDCQQCWKPHAEEMRRLLSLALRHEAEAAQARRELFDAKALNQELLEALHWMKNAFIVDKSWEGTQLHNFVLSVIAKAEGQ